MQYVLGSAGDYHRRLRALVGLFVNARAYRDEPLLGVHDQAGTLAGVAVVTLPGQREAPEALARLRERVWTQLGAGERLRYEGYGAACAPLITTSPHYHLNMIGVRRLHAGRGFARSLLATVHQMSDEDRDSSGVSLTTETVQNLPFYDHFGYRRVGHALVADGLETWSFFRPASGDTLPLRKQGTHG